MRSFHFPAVKLLLAYPLQEGCAAVIFGEKLKTERGKKGWTQEELAEKLFVSRQSVSKWENGQNYPSIEIIIKISDLFGLTIDELLRSDEELTKQVIKEKQAAGLSEIKIHF
ncbi:XRE family transcriptional regulator [Paenibacillus mucilaginosus 3016]|uniref:XRE family transcriptional regulator n=1 Tax=Paenibacillus mucilaginosus 3016 TaxID=1116391 RepID=H6NJG3_9BACL|nr:XRE family transcriptional regulator [Paenibacillus mucilaginosus 3016]